MRTDDKHLPLIWIDGELHRGGAGCSLHPSDHGVVVGDGAFETLRVLDGEAFAVTRHLARLDRSLSALGIDPPDFARVRGAVGEVARESSLDDGRLRLTVTGGPSPFSSMRGDGPATVFIAVERSTPVAPLEHVVVCPWTRNERGALTGVKSTSYAENVRALAWAKARGAGEALFENTVGQLAEGTGTNVFLVIDDQIVTPPESSGCLRGVTRELVLELADVEQRPLTLDDLRHATEVFLTSTTRDVQAVGRVDDIAITESRVWAAVATWTSRSS